MQKIKSGYDDSNDCLVAREHGNTHGDDNRGEHQAGRGGKHHGQYNKQPQYDGLQPVIKGLVFNYMGE